MKICKIKGCDKKHIARGCCPMHYARFMGKNKTSLNAPNQHPHYGQGWHIDKDGYKQIRIGEKSIREHRYVMEKHLGRKISHTEVVHHINGKILDNRIENLQIMSFREHQKTHIQQVPIEKKQKALELYRQGIAMTKIPAIIKGISYSIIYWFIRDSNCPIRGRHNRNIKNVKYYYERR